MKPILYNATETLFDSYGLGEMSANKATVTRERNGNYSLYIEYPVGGSLTPLFKQDMRIKADAGVRTKNQTFYISRIVKDSSHVIKIYAKHISHLTETMGIVHGTTVVGDANVALARWSGSLVGGVEFRTWSDIETEGKASWTVDKFRTAREALGGVEGSILDVWGGEYEFDNTTIRLHKQLGRKTPTVLQYGRNILSAEEDENSESSYTSIYPYASYTPEADEGGRQADPVFVTLPEKIVDSQWVKMYADRRVQVVDFSSKFTEKETPTLDKLRKIAERYVHDNRIGIPKTSIKVEYVDLAKTLDYADMAFMEEVELCDIVPIFYPKIGLTNEDGKVVVVNYDVLNDRNESIEIGTIGQGMKSAMVGSLGERLETLENRQIRLESNIPAYLLDGKGNKVWYQTPDNTREHKVGDTWFEKNGLYDRIYVWNGEMWEKRIDTEDVNVIAKEIDNKFKDFKSSTKLIEQKAEEALQNSGASSLLAQEAKLIGLDSVTKLEEFKKQATSAQTALSGDLDVLKRTIANDIRPKQEQAEAEIAKQVESLVQTKKELAGVKSAQATYEETTTRRLAELTNLANGKASKSELTQTAEELASKIASVRVGGVNLFKGSKDFSGSWVNLGNWTRESEKYQGMTVMSRVGTWFGISQAFETQKGEVYTLSFYIKSSIDRDRINVYFTHASTNQLARTSPYMSSVAISNEWQRTSVTFEITESGFILPRIERFNTEAPVYVAGLKLERGNISTDYSEAPEDIEGQISIVESSFRQRVDALDAGVSRLTEGLRTKADISSLNVTAENIRQSVKSLETDTQNKLNQMLSLAEFEVRASSIRQEILNATKDKADKTLVVAEAGKLRTELSTVQDYVNKDGQRKEELQRYTREESARQVNAVREQISREYVGKSTHQEDVRGIERRFEAITNPQNGTIATQIANYKQSVDGRLAGIISQIAGKANQTDFQRVQETSKLYERIIGRSESDIADKVARMALTNQLFQVEVAKNASNGQNLLKGTKDFSGDWKNKSANWKTHAEKYKGVDVLFKNNSWNGIGQEIDANIGEIYTFSLWMKSDWKNDTVNFYVNRNGSVEKGWGVPSQTSIAITNEWKRYSFTFNITKNGFIFPRVERLNQDTNLYVAGLKLEKGSYATPYTEAPEDTDEAIRTVQSQLAGSWGVHNKNSVNEIIAGFNLAGRNAGIKAETIRLEGNTLADKLTAIDGYFKRLFVGEGTFATLNTDILRANSITADKMVMDMAFFNKLVSNEAYLSQLFAKQAFITRVQSVTLDASQIKTGVLTGGRIQGGTITGSSISGGTITGGTITGSSISGATLTGHTKIKLGTYGSFDTVNGGLQINVPRTTNSKDGLGVQFIGSYGRGENVPYGLFIYKDPDLTVGDIASKSDDFLLTVEGYINAKGIGWLRTGKGSVNGKLTATLGLWNSSNVSLAFGGPDNDIYYSYNGTAYGLWPIVNKHFSDRRLKENIVDCKHKALDYIQQFQFKEYDWKKQEDRPQQAHTKIGLIAQEVQVVDPTLVYENGDTLNLDNLRLTNIALKAIQELALENGKLKQRLENLESEYRTA